MLQAVIFDMDGVLIDSEPGHMALEQAMFRELGLCITEAEHHGYVGLSSPAMWQRIIEKHGLKAEATALAAEETDRYLDLLRSGSIGEAIPGVIPLIQSLAGAGIPLAVASSAGRAAIACTLDRLGLNHVFSAIVSSEEVLCAKPAPDLFLAAAERLGVTPKGCLVLEDSANGVEGARRAAMTAVGYLSPHSGQQDLSRAHLVLHSLDGLDAAALQEIQRSAAEDEVF